METEQQKKREKESNKERGRDSNTEREREIIIIERGRDRNGLAQSKEIVEVGVEKV